MVRILEAAGEEVLSTRQPSSPRSADSSRSAGSSLPPADGTGGCPALQRKGKVRLFTFFEELAEPVKKLAQTAWAARGKLAGDVKAYTVLMATMIWSLPGRFSTVVSNPKLHKLFAEEEDPQALAAVLCGCSGALCLGSGGAVIGATLGGACGLALGAVPAIFTFGISLPVGAVIGGTCGFCTGAAVGGGTGLGAGAASGMTVAYFSDDIKYVALNVASRVYDVYDFVVVRPVTAVKTTSKCLGNVLRNSKDYTSAKARAVGNAASSAAANPAMQASAVGAGAGGVALGTAGAAGGTLVGGAAGALVGVIPAVFTFGLSIPIGAALGGGAGFCAGATAGTAAGATGGGLAGYAAYSYKSAPAKLYNIAADTLRLRFGETPKVDVD